MSAWSFAGAGCFDLSHLVAAGVVHLSAGVVVLSAGVVGLSAECIHPWSGFLSAVLEHVCLSPAVHMHTYISHSHSLACSWR